jgi:alpha-tubulin suppressor-like RCC1 family protein
VSCWGDNISGQLGDGTTTDRLTPVSVSGIANAVAVAVGAVHTCALLFDGTVHCWGSNSHGQLGDGTTTKRLTQVIVNGLTNAVGLTAGSLHTCALLADGTARCWGLNGSGQLGNGSTTNQSTPVSVVTLGSAVSLVAKGDRTCALLVDGTARCWGSNGSGQLGDGTTSRRVTPVSVVGIINGVSLAAGFSHTCALLADGTARCWGSNSDGQLGDGTTTRRLTPVAVRNLTSAVGLAAGDRHTCAGVADGTVRCWGGNDTGQLGDGTLTQRLAPVSVSGLANVVGVYGGSLSTCALLSDGSARCWGHNDSGEFGNGTQSDSLTPTTAGGGAGSVTARDIAAGGEHTCAVRADSTVACWGYNALGQLGDGTTSNRLTPINVSALSNATALAAGFFHTCALLGDGTVRCWGRNASGQLGDGSSTDRLTPVRVGGLTNVVAIAAGNEHTCALLADGSVDCWGSNGFGEIGNGGTTNRPTPTRVSGLTNAVAIAAGGFGHTCALLANGSARCWGRNDVGQLGDGTTTNRLTPVPVSGLTNAVALGAAGEFGHTCALLADGTARCWGDNSFGQLGDGTTTQRSVPSTVPGLTNAVALAVGTDHTCAVLATGGARCWGNNASGQLGDGTTTTRLTPTIVTSKFFSTGSLPLSGAVQITAGANHTCSLQSGGSVRCWGDNFFGQVGNGTTSDQLRAVGVPSFTLNIDRRVPLREDVREATVNILAACEEGQELHVDVVLTQGGVSGHGSAVHACVAGLGAYSVTVLASGNAAFSGGAATVQADAVIIENGVAVDTQQWTRAVQLLGTDGSLEGSASGVGSGTDNGSVRLSGQFTAEDSISFDQATLSITALLLESGGAGELVRGAGGAALLPMTLTARAGSTPTAAIYQTPSGVRPVVRAEVKSRDPETGIVEFAIAVDRATMPAGPRLCSGGQTPTTILRTRFSLHADGATVDLDITILWRCLGTQLKTP